MNSFLAILFTISYDSAISFKSCNFRHMDGLLTKSTKIASSSEVIDDISESKLNYLRSLKNELERRKLALTATEVAIKSIESELRDKSNTVTDDGTYDYGFISKSSGCYVDTENAKGKSGVPSNALDLGIKSFRREAASILGLFKKTNSSSVTDDAIQSKLRSLKLSNKAIWDREHSRPEVKAPLVIKIPYLVLCLMLDFLFDGIPISRFWFLETVARMPYFSYITMLHTYETLGWWRRSAEAKRVHFAEEWNEYHHLLIMESLGGDQLWAVRFFAQHAAIVYFFVLIALWSLSPSMAYNFSELIESHAVDTYAEFAEANADILKTMPPPRVAKAYYENIDMYAFDEFQTAKAKGTRRPMINTLYDVFCAIRDDEAEHVASMAACQDPNVIIKSPNREAAILAFSTAAIAASQLTGSDIDLTSWNSLLDGFSGDSIVDAIVAASGTGAALVKSNVMTNPEEAANVGAMAADTAAELKIVGTVLNWLKSILRLL